MARCKNQNLLRSGFFLNENQFTCTQAYKWIDAAINQMKDLMHQSTKKKIADGDQTMTGKELHQLIIECIQEYLPATVGNSGGKKKKNSLGPILDKFVKLADESEICEAYEPMKGIEETIRKHYENGSQREPDANATKQLKVGAHKLQDAYRKVIEKRTTEKGRIKEWLHVIREGNDSFRNVYDKIWQEIILNKEASGINRYRDSMSTTRQLIPDLGSKPVQSHSDPVELYKEAARVKPDFDKLIKLEICKRFKLCSQHSGSKEELEINIPPKLKRMTRIIEKTLLKGRDSVAHVKDIVRAMAVVKSMDAVAILLDIFCELHRAGLITMVRVKERFLESPSKGGWRDTMVNFYLVPLVGDMNHHICEFQIAHKSMYCARKSLPGHLYYGIVRNAMEMMDYCHPNKEKMYSADMAALVDFLPKNLDEGATPAGWLREDIPLGQWAGVTTNAEQQVVAVDLCILDPNLNRRHRLPHLQTLNLHGLDIKVNARYLDIIGRDYKYHDDFSVNLYGCAELTDGVLEGLTQLRGLVAIDLTLCRNISDALLAVLIKRNPHLHPDKVLSANKGAAFVEAVGNCRPNLEGIDLSGCAQITDAILAGLMLKNLHLHPDRVLSNSKGSEFLKAVGTTRPNLHAIDLSGCQHVTHKGLEHLAHGCVKLASVNLSRCCHVKEDAIRNLAQHCTKITTLDLSEIDGNTGAGFEDLARGCPNLTSVNLKGCKGMTTFGLEKLAYGCPNLAAINLEGCEDTSDFAVKLLAQNCHKLISINLNKCAKITDAALMQLAQGCPSITDIRFSGCKLVTDDSLKQIAENCSKLETIDLAGCLNITDNALRFLAHGYPNLVTVNLAECKQLTDVGLRHLAHNEYLGHGCRKLANIDLHACGLITDKGLMDLAQGCPDLLAINLNRCNKIGDSGLRHLAKHCKKLTTINLWRCKMVTDEGLKHLGGGCRNLASIDLQCCTQVTDCGIKHIAHGCPNLLAITLTGCTKITNESFEHLAHTCPKLTTVIVRECENISDEGLKFLAHGCHHLTTINLYMCCNVTDNGLQRIAQGCPKLTTIDLTRCTKITDDGVKYLAKGCHNISNISLWGCRKISDDGIEHLMGNCPKVSTINLEYCTRITIEDLVKLKQVYSGIQISHTKRAPLESGLLSASSWVHNSPRKVKKRLRLKSK